MATFDMSNNAAVLHVETFLEATANDAPVSKLQRVLVQVGVATASMAAAASIYRPPSDFNPVCFLGLAFAFVAGVAEVCAAFWVSGDAPARRGKGKMVLYASVVPLAMAASLGGFAINLTN